MKREGLLELASTPLIYAQPTGIVIDVARTMEWHRATVALIVEEGNLVGIFSEQDLLRRVVAKNLSLYHTPVADVMTSPVHTLSAEANREEAMALMHRGKFRHLPLTNEQGDTVGMLSLGDLLSQKLRELDEENKTLIAYLSADGVGG